MLVLVGPLILVYHIIANAHEAIDPHVCLGNGTDVRV